MHAHCGMHDASLDFKTAVRGIVPGYAGHVPRARDMYGTPAVGGITPERGWKRNERTGQMLEQTNLGPMGDRAYAAGPEGAASRLHAYSRRHNRVSDEVKPGFKGHVPNARDTFGTSHYRDSFTHRTGQSRQLGRWRMAPSRTAPPLGCASPAATSRPPMPRTAPRA